MRRLLTALGVDYDQWRALTIAALRVDFRTMSIGGTRTVRKVRGLGMIAMQVIVYSIMGGLVAFAVRWISDPFLAAVILMTVVIFMVGTTILVEHNSAVVSPEDYAILAFQPITSRTWFAARLTNVLVYTMGLATAVGFLPLTAFFLKHGMVMGSAAVPAMYAAAAAMTLLVMLGYGWMLRVAGPNRLRRALSWVQLLFSTLIYGGYIVVTRAVTKSVMATLTLPKTTWVLLYPATWFASWVELARGLRGWSVLLPAAASLAVVAGLLLTARGRLSLEYSARLGALSSASAARRRPGAAPARAARWFRSGEARAVAILVRSQFRNDMRFRMGVLGVIPLTLIYLYMGLQPGGSSGLAAARTGANLSLVTLAVMLFPATLKLHLGRSEAFRASWIFFATPADRTRIVRSAKDVLVAFFLLPYLLLVGALLLVFGQDPGYVAAYLLFAGLASHLVLLAVTFIEPELPFARPVVKGRGTLWTFFAILGIGVLGSLLPFLLRWLYGRPWGMLLLFTVLAGVSLLIHHLTRARVDRQAKRLEFEG